MPESNHTLRADHSYSTLFDWFRSTGLGALVSEPCSRDFSLLCRSLDHNNIQLKPQIGLEVHHETPTKTDFSIFGGFELLDTDCIEYPRFAKDWPAHLDGAEANASFPPDLIAEFDHTPAGYRLMGFFQCVNRESANLAIAMNAIHHYAASRTEIFANSTSNTEPLAATPTTDPLRSVFQAIGIPQCIGFVDRNMAVVKAVIPVEASNLEALCHFCGDHYSSCLSSEIRLQSLASFLEAVIKSGEIIRLSLDYDLVTGSFSDRLCFEYAPFLTCHSRRQHPMTPTMEAHKAFLAHFSGFSKSQELCQQLPYAEKRPSSRLIETETLVAMHHHAKLTLTPETATIKDYVLVYANRDQGTPPPPH